MWVVLQQGADALGRGDNVYTQQWTDSPGVQDFFPYLPWMAVLTAPGRWLAGDVRWAVLFWSLVLFAGLWALARGRVERAAAVTAVLVLAPGTLTQVDQAWTEPVLAALIVWWAVLVRRGHAWWAVLPLALACASKQHLALLAPVLLVWRPFGAWRTLATGGLAGAADAAVGGRRRRVPSSATRSRPCSPSTRSSSPTPGTSTPSTSTGSRCRSGSPARPWSGSSPSPRMPCGGAVPAVDELLRWLALVLAVANLVNKQAFYNQFWLVGALVAASLALPQGEPAVESDEAAALTTRHPFATSGALRRLRARTAILTSREAGVSRGSRRGAPGG